jgi:1-acyl-sn-glycerol-3-phosphate acyltransferase
MTSDFHEEKLVGEFANTEKSVLVVGNHSTWWDGFWAMYLNDVILKKNFYVLMLEAELKKRMFFSKVGAFSINPNEGGIKESLLFTKRLLSEKGNMVLFFPEGKFSPTSHVKKEFQKGISFFYKDEPTFKTLFVVFLIDYFANRKPTLYVHFQQKEFEKGVSHMNIETEYNQFFEQCIDKQKQTAT